MEERAQVPRWLDRGAALAWRALLIGAAVYVLLLVVGRLRVVVIAVVVALFLSTVLVPPTRWLRARGWPPLAAVWTVYFAGFLMIAGILVWLIPSVSHQFGSLQHAANKGSKRIQDWLVRGPLHLKRANVTHDFHQFGRTISKNRGRFLQGALRQASVALEVIVAGILSLVFAFFFVKDGPVITRWWLDLLSPEHADDMRTIGARAWRTLSGYIRGTTINGIVNGALMFIALLALGVPLAAPLAFFTFLGAYFPIVGAILTGGLAALIALVAKGPVAAAIVVGVTIVIHNVEGYLVGPIVLGRAVKLHTIVVLIALTAGGALGGVLGAFIAVPATAVALNIIDYYRLKGHPRDPKALLRGDGVAPDDPAHRRRFSA